MPSEDFSHRSLALVGVEQAWAALQRPATWGEIGGVSAIRDPFFDEVGLAGYEFSVVAAGRAYHGRALRIMANVGERMVMEIQTDLLDGEIDVGLWPAGEATEVLVAMSMASRGLMAGMLFPVIANSVATGFSGAAERFIGSLGSP